ncbi:MAG: nondiscriminating glutamyl-tRNA synthetase [Parcubacteria group bacterium LiPW_41]|nr:MAG: nondiscriminating glutamyl-tRNA synthetase [Parcubacteria group bacterium LiPW_41]
MGHMSVRVRFAPSPTGFLHIGGVRTALFNWLFAKKEGGKFILRIEDTDKERSEKRFEDDIIKNLEWFGIYSDEPIWRQSERTETYKNYLLKLIEEGKAYCCTCSEEDLEAEYQAQMSQGLVPKYSGRCRSRAKDIEEQKKMALSSVIRIKMPEETVVFNDVIRGKVSFETKLFGDIIIAKNLLEPLYNFAVVIDDHETKITHVIRGEEHLPNTPKQVVIQDLLGFPHVQYGHLPLILDANKKKLSKRFIQDALNKYREEGYLPSAVLNFLVLLGWHPENDREILTVEEMKKEFSLKRVQKAGAVYNTEKLDWLNAMHIRMVPLPDLVEQVLTFIPEEWKSNKEKLSRAVELARERMKKLSDFRIEARPFFEIISYDSQLLMWKDLPLSESKKHLEEILTILRKGGDSATQIMEYATKEGKGNVLWPLRVALSGLQNSPGPIELLTVLGSSEAEKRIEIAIQKIS